MYYALCHMHSSKQLEFQQHREATVAYEYGQKFRVASIATSRVFASFSAAFLESFEDSLRRREVCSSAFIGSPLCGCCNEQEHPIAKCTAFGAVSPARCMHVQRERRGVSGAERRKKEKEKQKKSPRGINWHVEKRRAFNARGISGIQPGN